MRIDERNAWALAHLLHGQRPDWPVDSIMTLLSRHRDVPSLGALTIAAMTKALEPTCHTPAPIFHTGPHWPEQARHNLQPAPRCEDHPTFDGPTCRCCWSEVKTGDRPRNQVGHHWTPPEGSTTHPTDQTTAQTNGNVPLSAGNPRNAPEPHPTDLRPAERRTAARTEDAA